MSSIILPSQKDCAIISTPKENCYFLVNNKTAWVAGLYVNFENRTYKITIIFDHVEDKVSLKYFNKFLMDNGWIKEK